MPKTGILFGAVFSTTFAFACSDDSTTLPAEATGGVPPTGGDASASGGSGGSVVTSGTAATGGTVSTLGTAGMGGAVTATLSALERSSVHPVQADSLGLVQMALDSSEGEIAYRLLRVRELFAKYVK
jgi:type II secretory pathway component HofQ